MIILISMGMGALIGLILILVIVFSVNAGEGAESIPAAVLAFILMGAGLGLIVGTIVYFLE